MLYHNPKDITKYKWTALNMQTGEEVSLQFSLPVDRNFFKAELKKTLSIKKLPKYFNIY